jgi:hypothetical protein
MVRQETAMRHEDKALGPAVWEASMTRFCNFMLMTARSDDARRLFQQFVAHEKGQSLVSQNRTAPSATQPSPTRQGFTP